MGPRPEPQADTVRPGLSPIRRWPESERTADGAAAPLRESQPKRSRSRARRGKHMRDSLRLDGPARTPLSWTRPRVGFTQRQETLPGVTRWSVSFRCRYGHGHAKTLRPSALRPGRGPSIPGELAAQDLELGAHGVLARSQRGQAALDGLARVLVGPPGLEDSGVDQIHPGGVRAERARP